MIVNKEKEKETEEKEKEEVVANTNVNKYKQGIVLLEKINFDASKGLSLSDLRISHYSDLLFVLEGEEKEFEENIEKKYFSDTSNSNSNSKSDFYLEPVVIRFIHNGKEHLIERYSLDAYEEFKNYLCEYLSSENLKIDIKNLQIVFETNGKKVSLDSIALDKKTNTFFSIRKLKLQEKILIVYTTKDKELANVINVDGEDSEDVITVIAKTEENSEDVKYISISLRKTFRDLKQKLLSAFELKDDFEYRFRKELTGNIVYSEDYDKELSTDEVFVEDSTRLTIEIGENYNKNEMLLRVIIEEKPFSATITKDFICVPETKLETVKKFICNSYKLEPQNMFKFHRVNVFLEPQKDIKNESLSLSTLKLKDSDFVYLKNSVYDSNNISFMKIFISDDIWEKLGLKEEEKKEVEKKEEKKEEKEEKKEEKEEKVEKEMTEEEKNDYEIALVLQQQETKNIEFTEEDEKKLEALQESIKSCPYVFKPIKDKENRFNLEFPKETKMKDVRKEIVNRLREMLTIKGIDSDSVINEDLIRLRLISNKMEVQNIFNLNSSIKTLNLYSPVYLYVEFLTEKIEPLTSKQLEIVLFERDAINKTFIKPLTVIFEWSDAPYASDLYDFVVKLTGLNTITLAKYYKPDYKWEKIVCDGENLKKSHYNLRDGDFIAYRNEELYNDKRFFNDWSTKEDKEMLDFIKKIGGGQANNKENPGNGKGGKGKKGRGNERAVRLTLEDY